VTRKVGQNALGAGVGLHGPPAAPGDSPGGVRSALVGRNGIMHEMAEALAQAVDFQAPQLITIIGNQGTGKTRLCDEFARTFVKPPTRVCRGAATQGGPRYEALSSYLRDRFQIDEAMAHERIVHGFRREVAATFGEERIGEVLHYLGSFLNLSFPDSPFLRVLSDNPNQRDQIARTVLRRFIELDAGSSPLVMILDDLHWADDQTITLIREISVRLSGSSVVMVVAARPDLLVRCPDWGEGVSDYLQIALRNLGPDDAATMFRQLLHRCGPLPEEVVDDAIEMTGGNPHFLEELVRQYMSNGAVDTSREVWVFDSDKAADTELPVTIEEAIEARIAALEAAERDVLEKGSIFGHIFWTGAIVALNRIEAQRADGRSAGKRGAGDRTYEWEANGEPIRKKVEQIIDDLVERDYLLRLEPEDSTIAGDVELVFKHNLERDLITRGTDSKRLSRYYRLAGQWLESKLSQRSEEQLEFLAQLYERGGDHRRAARCYLAGGDKARLRYANDQAVEFYKRGLAMIEDEDALARLEALHNLGDVLDLVGASDEALQRFREMLELSWLFDNYAKAGAAHSRLGRIYRRRGEYDKAMEHLRDSQALFEKAVDDRGVAGALDDVGKLHWMRGSYTQALTFHRQALSIRRALGDRRSIALSLANIGRVHRDSGAFKAAVERFREALDLRRDAGDLPGVVQSLCDLGGVHAEDGNFKMALDLFGEAHRIAVEIGDKMSEAQVLSRLGECRAATGEASEGMAHLEYAIELAASLGDQATLSDSHRRCADVALAAGDVARAQRHAQQALEVGLAIGSRVHIGTAHRVIGAALTATEAAGRAGEDAEEHFRKAIEILAGIKNDLELARCYRAFAGFRERTGESAEAGKLRRRADEIYDRLRGAASTD
jgi:tetratricopeptide (TPR) repeat protein